LRYTLHEDNFIGLTEIVIIIIIIIITTTTTTTFGRDRWRSMIIVHHPTP
jgi:hypothetical protein